MGDVVLHQSQIVPGNPFDLFARFGRTGDSGWLFSAECDSVRPGATVSLEFPMPGVASDGTVRILGRLSKVVPGKLIVLSHDQPWSGRTRIAFDAVQAGSTKVTVRVELDDDGIAWLTRRLGLDYSRGADGGRHRVGLLTSKTGPGAIFAVACENLAHLSIDEVNADGGVHGSPLELMIGDDGTDAVEGVREAQRLISSGCRIIIASVTSATFEAVRRAVEPTGVPLVHAVLNEGGEGSTNVMRCGERPWTQLSTAGRPLMQDAGVSNWFLVGNDYSWSHGAHAAARRVLPSGGGRIAGEILVDHGTTDFAEAIERIRRSGADCILSSLVGADEVAFERQAYDAGLRDVSKTLSLVLDESTHERIGPEAARGLRAVSGYFEGLESRGNREFIERYRSRYGRWAPPISSFSRGVYEAVQLYVRAARSEQEGDLEAVARSMRRIAEQSSARLAWTGHGGLEIPAMHVAESTGEALRVISGG